MLADSLTSGVQVVQYLLLAVVVVLIAIAPVGCWSVLGRMLKVQQAMLDEMKAVSYTLRKQRADNEELPSGWRQPVRKENR